MVQALATVPSHLSEPYSDTTGTVARMMELARGPRGELSLRLRMTVEGIVRYVQPRDRLSQLAAIYDWFDKHFRYVNDPLGVELVKDPERLLEEIAEHGVAVGDCDDASTFLYAAPRTIGIPTEFTRANFKAGQSYSHVFAMAQDQHGRWIVLDPVAGPKTGEMIGRIKSMALGLGAFTADDSRLVAASVGGLAGVLLGGHFDPSNRLPWGLFGAVGAYLLARGITGVIA